MKDSKNVITSFFREFKWSFIGIILTSILNLDEIIWLLELFNYPISTFKSDVTTMCFIFILEIYKLLLNRVFIFSDII